jgi:hypothetical protein
MENVTTNGVLPAPVTGAGTLPPLPNPSSQAVSTGSMPVVPVAAQAAPVVPPMPVTPVQVVGQPAYSQLPPEPVIDPDPVATPTPQPVVSNLNQLPPLADQFPAPESGVTEVAGAPIVSEESGGMPSSNRSLYIIIFVLLVLVTLLAGLSLLLLLRG